MFVWVSSPNWVVFANKAGMLTRMRTRDVDNTTHSVFITTLRPSTSDWLARHIARSRVIMCNGCDPLWAPADGLTATPSRRTMRGSVDGDDPGTHWDAGQVPVSIDRPVAGGEWNPWQRKNGTLCSCTSQQTMRRICGAHWSERQRLGGPDWAAWSLTVYNSAPSAA
jgi:hypothetical protein